MQMILSFGFSIIPGIVTLLARLPLVPSTLLARLTEEVRNLI